jgi:hypothetical protein
MAEGWTVAEALEQFAAAGMPVDPVAFRLVIRAARRTGKLRPVSHTPPGEHGGRGWPRYGIGDLQQLHRDNARWLAVPATGDGPAAVS